MFTQSNILKNLCLVPFETLGSPLEHKTSYVGLNSAQNETLMTNPPADQ